MKYHDKSFSVSLSSDAYRDNYDRVFRRQPTAPVGEEQQCTACLATGTLAPMEIDGEAVPGLLQCGTCAARVPVGVERAAKFHGEAACVNCGGTGRLRTNFTLFACGECGGTGARQPAGK
jgi:DnaJ-class molecular chaperone